MALIWSHARTDVNIDLPPACPVVENGTEAVLRSYSHCSIRTEIIKIQNALKQYHVHSTKRKI